MPDLHDVNSWTQRVDEVDPVELLEVQLCNSTAPFILISRLRAGHGRLARPGARTSSTSPPWRASSAVATRDPGHPHTNMAKAALNMLTRTSAEEMLTDGILMTAVDTGWITDERPHPTKMRLAEEGFHAPLDLVDGAARVYDPIVRGERARTCTAASSRTTGRPPGRARRGRRPRQVAPIGGPRRLS